MINTTSERLKAINFFICQYFSFYEQLKFRAQFSWAQKKFHNLGSGSIVTCYAHSVDSDSDYFVGFIMSWLNYTVKPV